MPVNVNPWSPVELALPATTVTVIRLLPTGSVCRSCWVSSAAPVYLVYGVADGAAAPAANRFRIPAGWPWEVQLNGPAPGVFAETGTPLVSFMAEN